MNTDSKQKKIFYIVFSGLLCAFVICAGLFIHELRKLTPNQENSYAYEEVTIEELAQMFDDQESFAILLHKDGCSICAVVEPAYEEFLREYGYTGYHLNYSSALSDTTHEQSAVWDFNREYLKEVEEQDDEGKDYLDVPQVVFVKNGTIVYNYVGAADSWYDHMGSLSSEEKKEMSEAYAQGYQLLR